MVARDKQIGVKVGLDEGRRLDALAKARDSGIADAVRSCIPPIELIEAWRAGVAAHTEGQLAEDHGPRDFMAWLLEHVKPGLRNELEKAGVFFIHKPAVGALDLHSEDAATVCKAYAQLRGMPTNEYRLEAPPMGGFWDSVKGLKGKLLMHKSERLTVNGVERVYGQSSISGTI